MWLNYHCAVLPYDGTASAYGLFVEEKLQRQTSFYLRLKTQCQAWDMIVVVTMDVILYAQEEAPDSPGKLISKDLSLRWKRIRKPSDRLSPTGGLQNSNSLNLKMVNWASSNFSHEERFIVRCPVPHILRGNAVFKFIMNTFWQLIVINSLFGPAVQNLVAPTRAANSFNSILFFFQLFLLLFYIFQKAWLSTPF